MERVGKMKRVIHKQVIFNGLDAPLKNSIKLPLPFKIIHVGRQSERDDGVTNICVWYEIDEDQYHGVRDDGSIIGNFTTLTFACVGTGSEFSEPIHDGEMTYLTTMHEGPMVLHIYASTVGGKTFGEFMWNLS